MSDQNVPVERTPIDMRTYARALARAWNSVIGGWPTKEQAGVLWAQYGIETGAGPWCWNWNIGNVKHVPGDGYDYMMLAGTWEMINGKRVVFQPPDPATWFRAYPNLDEAMLHHFGLLRGKRYAAGWEGVELGDCGLFARRLKAAGYYTADATAYTNGMLAHFRRWMAIDAFESAMREIEETSRTPTLPIVEAANDNAPVVIDGGTVHPELYDGDPPEAA